MREGTKEKMWGMWRKRRNMRTCVGGMYERRRLGRKRMGIEDREILERKWERKKWMKEIEEVKWGEWRRGGEEEEEKRNDRSLNE